MSLRVNTAVVAEDVRREISGKDILIGVYGGDIMVPGYPATMTLALWFEMEIDTAGAFEAQFEVSATGNPPLFLQFGAEATEVGTSAIGWPGLGFKFDRDGEIVIRFRVGEELAEVKRKRVR